MTEPFPTRPPLPPAPRGKDFTFVVVLLILAILTVILWFADPAHQWPDRSRVDWPPPISNKP